MIKIQKIKKKIQQSFLPKAAVLISFKEACLFLKNLYGLIVHPFKTIVRIRKKPDWSQTILVLGMPIWGGLGFLGILGLVGIGFWLFRPTSQILVRVILVGLGLGALGSLGILGYVGYWVGRYLIWRREIPKP